jgi:hypothetical protein
MRTRPIVVLLALVTVGGCKIDNRSLTMTTGSGGGGAAGHGGATGFGGFRASGGATGAAGGGGSTLPTILLGNFENDTAVPPDLRFNPYQYYAYNPSYPPPGAFVTSPLVSPGYDSNFALGLNWKVIDPLDGVPNYPGVGVRTVVGTGFVDLSGYDRIVFAQLYQHTDSCKALQSLSVVIGCDELNTSYVGAVAPAPTWTTSTLAFKGFVEQSYTPPSGYSLAQCLAVANRVDFQANNNLADGDCASGSLSLDNIEIRGGGAPGVDAGASAGILLVPDSTGAFDGSNAAGVIGAWGSTGDDYAPDGTPGAGDCPKAGFSQPQCSTITTPIPGQPFTPDVTGRMCTSGVAALVAPLDGGQPAYSSIWGNFIFFDLNHPPSPASDGGSDGGLDAGSGIGGVYDATAHGITGFAFDLEGTVSRLRVEFATMGTELNAAYWEGALMDLSPVSGAGHYEIRWADVGGPAYLTAPPPFDPTKLERIQFHVPSQAAAATPYSFCLKNITLLTGP